MRFVAFLETVYDEVFSGYQLGQMVEWWKNCSATWPSW